MKIKAIPHITNAVDFTREPNIRHVQFYLNNVSECFDNCIVLPEIEIDLGDIDQDELVKMAIQQCDVTREKLMEEMHAKLATLEETKQSLLAISYQPEEKRED